VLVVVAVLALVALVAVPFAVDTPRMQTLIASGASQALGRPVKFASISAAVFPWPAVELYALEIGEDPHFGTAPFVKLDTGRLTLRVRPLLRGRIAFGALTLARCRAEDVDLTLTAGGATLRFEGGARLQPGDLAVRIAEGRLATNGARSLAEAPLSALVTVEGRDVAALVALGAGAGTSVSGAVSATLTVGGTLGAPTAAGTLELASPRITET